MSETAPETVEDTPTAVYDEAELRFVDNLPGKTAVQTAAELNKSHKGKIGRADGSSGKRYTTR